MSQNKLAHEKYAAQKLGLTATKTSIAPAATFITSVAPANFQFAQILQSHIQEVTTTTTSNSSNLPTAVTLSKLTENKRVKLIKFDWYFNY